MVQYTCIYQNKQFSECAWYSTQNKVTVQITEQLSRPRHIQNTVKHLRWSDLQEEELLRIIRRATRNFLQPEYYDEHVKKIFLLDNLKTTFWMEN